MAMRALGLVYQLSRTGGEGNPPEHYLTHMDYGCGLTSAVMVIAALVEREHSGIGQYIEVPQTGAGLLAMSDVHGKREQLSETFPLDREQRGHAPTNALYRTSDGWIMIACYSDREWSGVQRALAFYDAPWPPFAEARAQRLGASAIARIIEARLANTTTQSALRRFRAEAVPSTVPVTFGPTEAIDDPTMLSRGVIVREEHYDAGEIFEVGHTLRFGNATALNLLPAPVTGQHSVEILRERGRSEDEINALIANKLVNVPERHDAAESAFMRPRK
jgi:crotonobetainyl-CoA:carnitine CoA-transferase CaiB-like acyl-CoA transferase